MTHIEAPPRNAHASATTQVAFYALVIGPRSLAGELVSSSNASNCHDIDVNLQCYHITHLGIKAGIGKRIYGMIAHNSDLLGFLSLYGMPYPPYGFVLAPCLSPTHDH